MIRALKIEMKMIKQEILGMSFTYLKTLNFWLTFG